MANVHDVAAFILGECGPMTAMKLHKLLYYCQAWSLVWDDASLFPEKIEAWANGPVVRDVYSRHRGEFEVHQWPGNPGNLDDNQKDTIKKVLAFYAHRPTQWLVNLTHREAPWRKARHGLKPEERGNKEITIGSMAEFYSTLQARHQDE